MSIFVNAAGRQTWFDQTSVSVVLVPTTAQVIFMFIFRIFVSCQFLHKKFTNFTFHIIICTQISKYPNGCYLHMIIMHRTVIASIITNFTLLSISSFVHKYPNIQSVNTLPLFLHHCKCPIHKLYFPYHHLYTNIQISKWLLFAHDYYAQNSNCLHN